MITLFFIKYSAYLIFPIIGFFLSLLLTKLCIKLLPAIGLVDEPVGGRHIHKRTVPTGGGLAVIGAFFIIWLCFLLSHWGYFIGTLKLNMFSKVGVLSCLIIILGIVDDKFALKAKVKLISQILIATLCWACGIHFESIFGFELHDTISLILTVFWIVSFINAFNLIDGMDGLASGLGVISAICMATVFAVSHAPNDTVVVLCLAACCCGFLIYNFHPAKIFLGDTGSMFLGFMFALIGIVSSNESAAATAILIPMLAAGVPIFDVILAIWRRFTRNFINQGHENGKGSIAEADKEHLHHRMWKKEGHNQRTTTYKIYFLSAAFAIVAILNLMKKDTFVGLSYVLMLILIFTAVRRIAHIELWNTGKAILTGFNLPRKSIIVSVVQPFFDIAMIIIIYLLCRFLFMDSAYNAYSPLMWHVCTIFAAAPIVLALNLGGSYKRNWLHGSAPDYIYFIKCLLAGFVLLILFDLFRGISEWRSFVAERLLFFALITLVLLGERLFLRYLKYHLIHIFYIEKSHGIVLQKTLVCGAGSNCRYFIANQSWILEEHPNRIIGIIEEDPLFQGQYIFGLKVLGRPVDIKKIYAKTRFDKITITKAIDNSTRKLIVDFCKTNKILLTEWNGRESASLDI